MQTTRLSSKPTHEIIAAIKALDLTSVKVRMMDPELGEGWGQDYADSIESAYKTYLTMLAKYQEHAEDIMLAKDVDEFWHTHILQTMKYADDCQNVFGAFLHHNPHVGKVTAEDLTQRAALADKTRHLYNKEYGNRSNVAWSGSIKPEGAAYSSASRRADQAAYSSAAVGAENAAYSSAAIAGGSAAYSSAAIRAQSAAYSSAAIQETDAAYSSAAIRAGNAAYSSAAIHAGKAAYSSAAIQEQHAAYSSAAIRAGNAAYSSAAIDAGNAAYSSAATRAESAARSSATAS